GALTLMGRAMKMSRILDEIHIEAKHVPQLLARLDQDYLPAAQQRGLQLEQRWVSPPVAIPGRPNVLWLLWQVPEGMGYYGMRAQQGPEVAAFWAALEPLISERHRHVLGDADQALPQPEDIHHGA